MMRNVLAIETSAEPASLAVMVDRAVSDVPNDIIAIAMTGQQTILQCAMHEPRRHNEHVLRNLDRLLALGGLTAADLDGVVFGRGPGSFTGVRLATSVAQALHVALELNILAIDSLLLIAEHVRARRLQMVTRTVAVALDAKMGEAYLGLYERANDQWQTLREPVLVTPEIRHGAPNTIAVADVQLPNDTLLAGDGWRLPWLAPVVAEQGGTLVAVDPAMFGADLLRIAPELLANNGWMSADAATPLYLRTAQAWRKHDD